MENINSILPDLQKRINAIIQNPLLFTITEYNYTMKLCAMCHEMGAAVYVYDTMKNTIAPDKETYNHLSKLHSKTLPEYSSIQLPYNDKRVLQHRRRIHKIMKGYNYTDLYNAAKIHIPAAKTLFNANNAIKLSNKNKQSKYISDNLSIPIKTAKYVITALKREKFFKPSNTFKPHSLAQYIASPSQPAPICTNLRPAPPRLLSPINRKITSIETLLNRYK